ncbi:hypothetical protein V5799_020777 [Amblyomma americanum]|uniref:SET domain-containing protein n=1 Tax=Amblyomma americanum TaxID=6943 RepID=A0AAQ4ET08_AMBAM
MRYMNCTASPQEQNLVAFRRYGNISYWTPKAVGASEELLVWYGEVFARELGLLGKPRCSGPSLKGEGLVFSRQGRAVANGWGDLI